VVQSTGSVPQALPLDELPPLLLPPSEVVDAPLELPPELPPPVGLPADEFPDPAELPVVELLGVELPPVELLGVELLGAELPPVEVEPPVEPVLVEPPPVDVLPPDVALLEVTFPELLALVLVAVEPWPVPLLLEVAAVLLAVLEFDEPPPPKKAQALDEQMRPVQQSLSSVQATFSPTQIVGPVGFEPEHAPSSTRTETAAALAGAAIREIFHLGKKAGPLSWRDPSGEAYASSGALGNRRSRPDPDLEHDRDGCYAAFFLRRPSRRSTQ
jgi:hypothetical protein